MYCNSNYAILLLKKYCNSQSNCNRNSNKIWPKYGPNLRIGDCCCTFTFWFYISIGKNQNAKLGLSFFSWCCLALRKANSTAQKSSWVLSFTLLLMIGQMIHTTPATKIITHFVLDDWAQKFQAFKFCSKLR